jgi:transporter family-2 protein
MTIMQTALNREIGNQSGLAIAVLINAAIVVVFSVILVIIVRSVPDYFPSIFKGAQLTFDWKWWYIIPGICGFCVILGLPFAMSRLGALNVFISFVTAQVMGSLLWDIFIDKIAMTTLKTVGAFLALLGIILVVWR